MKDWPWPSYYFNIFHSGVARLSHGRGRTSDAKLSYQATKVPIERKQWNRLSTAQNTRAVKSGMIDPPAPTSGWMKTGRGDNLRAASEWQHDDCDNINFFYHHLSLYFSLIT